MKTTTGRRFRDTEARSSQSNFVGKSHTVESKKILSQERNLRQNEKPISANKEEKPLKKQKEMAVENMMANRISLTELHSQDSESCNSESLRSSRTFEIEKNVQKGTVGNLVSA